MMHWKRSLLGASALLGMLAGAGPASAQVAGVPAPQHSCQRACLEGYVDRYLAAMAEGGFDEALFARDVRFTENGVELPLGDEGLWATASGVGQYKFYVPDVETQQVAFLGTVLEQAGTSATGAAGEPELVGLSLRLRIGADGKITEVEQIAARPERPLGVASEGASAPSGPFAATGAAVEAMGSPHPMFLEAVPEAQRHTREELVAVGNAYFDAVERNTGKDYYPFTDDCLRMENGLMIAGPPGSGSLAGTCKGQLETSLIGAVSGIRDRRFVAVDRERGIVFAFAFFDHRPINWSWQLGELFRIENGMIRRIEAIFIRGPYGMCSGWSTYEQCRSEKIQDVR